MAKIIGFPLTLLFLGLLAVAAYLLSLLYPKKVRRSYWGYIFCMMGFMLMGITAIVTKTFVSNGGGITVAISYGETAQALGAGLALTGLCCLVLLLLQRKREINKANEDSQNKKKHHGKK